MEAACRGLSAYAAGHHRQRAESPPSQVVPFIVSGTVTLSAYAYANAEEPRSRQRLAIAMTFDQGVSNESHHVS